MKKFMIYFSLIMFVIGIIWLIVGGVKFQYDHWDITPTYHERFDAFWMPAAQTIISAFILRFQFKIRK